MAVLRSNLPVAAQPWGRDVDNRLGNLEVNVTKTLINTAANDLQFKASLDATNKTVTKLDGVIANIYTPGTDSINASKITTGTLSAINISGVTITGSTLSTATTGARLELTASKLVAYNSINGLGGAIFAESYTVGSLQIAGTLRPAGMTSQNTITIHSSVDGYATDASSLSVGDEEIRISTGYSAQIVMRRIADSITIDANTVDIVGTVYTTNEIIAQGTIKASKNNATGGGVWIGDDGDIVDLNDGYASMRFSNGVRIFSGNKTGSAVITLGSNGDISTGSIYASGTVKTSQNNATGGGVWIGDDGDIVDLNDGYASMRFSNGVRIFSGNKGGSAKTTLDNYGNIYGSGFLSVSGNVYSGTGIFVGKDGTLLQMDVDTTGPRVYSMDVYNRGYSSGQSTMVITSYGTFGRLTSASKYKLVIEDKLDDYSKILNIKPKHWFDKTASEAYADYLTKIYENGFALDGQTLEPVERVTGLIAEDLIEAGLENFVNYGMTKEDGTREVEGIQYDRLWVYLIPLVKELTERVTQLENK